MAAACQSAWSCALKTVASVPAAEAVCALSCPSPPLLYVPLSHKGAEMCPTWEHCLLPFGLVLSTAHKVKQVEKHG